MTAHLSHMMGDPVQQIEELIVGTGLIRKAELDIPVRTTSPEYDAAFELFERAGEYMTDSQGDEQFVIPVSRAADLTADYYEKRVL